MELSEILELKVSDGLACDGFGPLYPWGGLYGGQIVAQALLAAGSTVDEQFVCHSLRAYFIRRGVHNQTVHYQPEALRDGRSYCTRRVVAHQGAGAILNLEASFALPEQSEDVELVRLPSGLPAPGAGESSSWTPAFERSYVPNEILAASSRDGEGRAAAWMKARGDFGDNRLLHQAALAYLSDDLPTDAVVRSHPAAVAGGEEVWNSLFSASLDHSIWFHRPVSATEWHLHDFSCHTFVGGRGLSIGHIFDEAGSHIATVAQEVLLRFARH